ncbi:MAG TPA: hypothetical protein VIP09_07775 [Dehalococcoidia bacterium]
MQTVDDRHLAQRVPVNLRAGLQALAAAFCLACIGVAYHGVLSIGGAAVIAAYAIVIPLRLPGLLFSWPFARFVLQAVARVAAAAGVICVLGIAINSGLPIIDTFAGVLFIGVLALGAVMTLRAAGRQALEIVPRLTIASRRVKALISMQLSLVWSSVLPVGPDESDFAGESRASFLT